MSREAPPSREPYQFPVPGERTGITWDQTKEGRYWVVCVPCGHQSGPMSRKRAEAAVRQHIERSRTHRVYGKMRSLDEVRSPKQLTHAHLMEMSPEDVRSTRRGLRRYERLDQRARAEGYGDGGTFRPWKRKHLRELAARTGDEGVVALLDRLDEISAARAEEAELLDALREWEPVAALIDRTRGA